MNDKESLSGGSQPSLSKALIPQLKFKRLEESGGLIMSRSITEIRRALIGTLESGVGGGIGFINPVPAEFIIKDKR